jgi:predicted phosphodiesterase
VTVAILSDIHGNREALEAVLAAVASRPAREIWCLGDLVGYNPDPDFCVDEILRRAARVVRGNHDKAVAGLLSLEWFNPTAKEAIVWTRRASGPGTLQRLARLPEGPAEAGGGVVLCHGTPMDEDRYMVERGAIADALRWMRSGGRAARVCFHGHTHLPFACSLRDGASRPETLPTEGEIGLEPGRIYLINPGSVGQPRDGIPLASFGILDVDRSTYVTLRVAYDVGQTRRKILEAGLPRELAWRLGEGT